MDFFTLLAQPSRAKAFDPSRPVSHEVLAKLTWAAERAPAAAPTRCWHVEVVRTDDGKRRLAQVSAGGRPPREAAVLLVFCAERSLDEPANVVDAGVAAFATRLAAVALGLAVDWVAVQNAAAVSQALDLQSKLVPVVVLAIGYER